MNLIWLKRNKDEWISIDLDTIKSFSSCRSPVRSDREFRTLYVNNKSVVSDHEQILYKALEKYMIKPEKGSKYYLQSSVIQYNKGISNE